MILNQFKITQYKLYEHVFLNDYFDFSSNINRLKDKYIVLKHVFIQNIYSIINKYINSYN